MLWWQIGDVWVNLTEVRYIHIGETVRGFCSVIAFKDRQVINVGNYAHREEALRELDNLRQKLLKANPQSVLEH